jgi:transposase
VSAELAEHLRTGGADQRKSGRTRKGYPWLRTGLVEIVQAAGRVKQTYLGALYQRWRRRLDKKTATVAVAHPILVIAYYVLLHKTAYDDLGSHYFEERDRKARERRLIRGLEGLGYQVTVETRSPAA